MILSCTDCGARFKVDPSLLGQEGRTVRCGSCGHSWHQMPGQGEPAAPDSPDSALDKLDEQRERARARRPVVTSERSTGSARALGWVALALFLVGIAGLLVFAQEKIMATSPGTARFYEMVGLLEVVGEGLDLRDVLSERREVDGERTLVIEGTIVNRSDQLRRLPELRASLVDAAGMELTTWTFLAKSDTLPPGGFTTFETSAVNPPDRGKLTVVFIERREPK